MTGDLDTMIFDSANIDRGRRLAYLDRIFSDLPETCHEGMLCRRRWPMCGHCWDVVRRGYRQGQNEVADALDDVICHLANQDCDGALELRRRLAGRALNLILRPKDGR